MKSAAGKRLVIRADASPDIGAGHLMRLTALAEAWIAAGGEAGFIGTAAIPFAADRLARLPIAALDGADVSGDVLVVDSYDRAVRATGSTLGAFRLRVLVDDTGDPVPDDYQALWNPNPYPSEQLYRHFKGWFLGGTGAVPLRSGLPTWTGQRGVETMIALGGGQPPTAVVAGLRIFADLVRNSPIATNLPDIHPSWRVVEAAALWRETATAARLVTAAGVTTWEAAAVGIPLVVIQTAPNQRLVYRWARGAGVPGLNALLTDPEHFAQQLHALLPAAVPLPALHNGAPHIVDELVGHL